MLIEPIKFPILLETEDTLRYRELGINNNFSPDVYQTTIGYFYGVDAIIAGINKDGTQDETTTIIYNKEEFVIPLDIEEVRNIINECLIKLSKK